MAAINSLCNKGLILTNGNFSFLGTQKDAILKYTSENNLTNYYKHEGDIQFALGNDCIKLIEFKVYPKDGKSIKISTEIVFELVFYNFQENINLDSTFELSTNENIVVFHSGTIITDNRDSKIGIYNLKGVIPSNLLNSGVYKFKIIFGENQRYCLYSIDEIIQFEVLNETIGSNSFDLPGILRPNLNYDINFNS
jgi:lipopolysaccharide transport system ATP-binding protein